MTGQLVLPAEPPPAHTTLRKLGWPPDIGAMACFLGSPAAGWINGAIMSVDGARSPMRALTHQAYAAIRSSGGI